MQNFFQEITPKVHTFYESHSPLPGKIEPHPFLFLAVPPDKSRTTSRLAPFLFTNSIP